MSSIPIPNALTITINTSVPGYQKIKYKPKMTIPNIDEDETTIWFEPLVSLNQSVINKVPENIKVLEFFNKGLFNSLINAHGNQKQMTLEQAKKNKIIDNNIQVTLNTLFPTNGILYIKGEPYAIADVQWKKGDWKIDRKVKNIPEVDVTKISDPITYSAILKNNIQTGNEQLLRLPQEMIYGINFDKSSEIPSSIDTLDKIKKPEETRLKPLEYVKPVSVPVLPLKDVKPVSVSVLPLKDVKPVPVLPIENTKPQLQLEDVKPLSVSVLPIENSKPQLQLQLEDSQAAEEIQNIQMSEDYKPILRTSTDSTKILRLYFGNKKFYSMISMIFKYMTDDQKIFIQNIFKNTTNIEVKELTDNISIAAYNFTLTGIKNISSGGVSIKKPFTDGLRVISNTGGGNCLFIAVADAINYYNYNNNIDNKLIYDRYGNGNNLFTTKVLRHIVSLEIVKLFNSNEESKNELLELGRINMDKLNNIYERSIIDAQQNLGPEISEDYYNTTMMDIYKSSDNFFVIPGVNSKLSRPFKLIETSEEIIDYIESPYYWADEKTIDIINKILKLNIIVIKKSDDKFTIPYPNIKNNDKNNMWNKYLFLYNNENHYELITFDYLKKVSSKFVRIKKTIFNRGDNIIPPFYILFLLFSTFYIKLLPGEKERIVLFEIFLYAIQNSFNNIMSTSPSLDKNIAIFNNNFQDYFGEEEIHGGSNIQNIGAKKFLKKEDNQDDIQISFYITIDMELQKGKTLSKEQISNIKCVKGWNNVRKSFAEFTGQKYIIPPVYENLSDKYNKKEEPKDNNNNTKKNITGGKKRRKTMKNI